MEEYNYVILETLYVIVIKTLTGINMDYIKLSQPIIIFGLLVLIFTFILKRYPVAKTTAVLDTKDKKIIGLLTLIYGVISFCYFGSFNNFGSWRSDNLEQSFGIVFSKPEQIDKIYYYYGIGDGNLSLEYTTDQGESGIFPFKNEWSFYKWQSINFPVAQNIRQLIIKTETPGIELKQLALFNNNQQITDFKIIASEETTSKLATVVSNKSPEYYDNSYLSSTFFDEVYYARTAYEYLHGLPPYSWVHPPLGMLLIAIGIILFGINPVGWRFIPDITGIVMIAVIYIFAKELFKSRKAAIISSLLLMFDFMHFTMGRMASIDSSATLFILCEYYFLFKYFTYQMKNQPNNALRSLLFCGLFFGLAMATKWQGLYTAPLLLICLIYVEFFRKKSPFTVLARRIYLYIILLVLLPICIYLFTYSSSFMINQEKNILAFVLNMQEAMLNYHHSYALNVTHPYSSSWWSWPLLIKPLSLYYWQNNSGLASSIVLIGNPAIWWGGIIAVTIAIKDILKNRSLLASQILLMILSLYFPWVFVGRLSFIYYFYSVTPFWILAITYFLNQQLQFGNNKYVYGYLFLCGILFTTFYPVISGVPFYRTYVIKYLLWFSSWNF